MPIRGNTVPNLQQCLVTETTIRKIKQFLTCLCRLPSQNDDEPERFCFNLNFHCNNINKFQPSCLIFVRDFNEKLSKRSSSDKNIKAVSQLDNITSNAGHKQMINTPIHFIKRLFNVHWFEFFFKHLLLPPLELSSQFTKNVTIISYTENWIAIHHYHRLTTGKYGISKKVILKA